MMQSYFNGTRMVYRKVPTKARTLMMGGAISPLVQDVHDPQPASRPVELSKKAIRAKLAAEIAQSL